VTAALADAAAVIPETFSATWALDEATRKRGSDQCGDDEYFDVFHRSPLGGNAWTSPAASQLNDKMKKAG
jgi:hypothetical protein